MEESLISKIESSISDCRAYNFDFYYKNKGITEPRFVKCSVNFPIWYPVDEYKEYIYNSILLDFTMNDPEVSISYVKHSKLRFSEKEIGINFCLRDYENNMLWTDYDYYTQKWKPPKVNFSNQVTKKHKVIVGEKAQKDIFIFYYTGEKQNLLETKPEFMWPNIYNKHDDYGGYNEILELLFKFLMRSYKCIYEIYSSKYLHASGQVQWYCMERSENFKIRYIPENLDDKKLESYQLESTYQDYEDKLRYKESDYNDAGEITGGMYEGDWDDIKEFLGY